MPGSRMLARVVIALGLLVVAAAPALALQLPERPSARVNDYANALSPDAKARLEAQLASYEAGRTGQIAVAIFPSLDGGAIEDTSMRLAEKWKIGSKKNDDGVLLTVFVNDHKLRIECGFGVEDKLTDARSSQIIRDVIAPRFRAGDTEKGIAAGVAAIDTAITGRDHAKDAGAAQPPSAPVTTAPSPRSFIGGGGMTTMLILLLVLVPLLRMFFGRRRRSMLGGGWSGGSRGWSVWPIVGGGLLGGMFGGGRRSGGGMFGGGGGGMFGGGGGFSGGGGSFGGGGASGSW